MLSTKANGKLFPDEAMGALMEYAFKYLSTNKINAYFTRENLATQRFVKKLGFVYDEVQQPQNAKYAYQYFNKEQWFHTLINTVL